MNHLNHMTSFLGGRHVTARSESPTDCSLQTPGTVATVNGLVCVSSRMESSCKAHAEEKKCKYQLVWRPLLVSRFSAVLPQLKSVHIRLT